MQVHVTQGVIRPHATGSGQNTPSIRHDHRTLQGYQFVYVSQYTNPLRH
jgi:hypothetical protein